MTTVSFDATDYCKWKSWSVREFGQYDRGMSAYFALECLRAGFQSLATRRVLEIGFGNGSFATWATKSGAIYSGIEAIPKLVEIGRSKGLDVHHSADSLDSIIESGTVDLAVAFDVFEHLDHSQILMTLKQIRVSLRPDGLLLGRVPSGDSPFARAIQYGDLTHVSVIGSSAVRQIAMEAGYEVIAIREPAFPLLGFGAQKFLRRLLVVSARKCIHALVTYALMDGGAPVLTPNLVFILRPAE